MFLLLQYEQIQRNQCDLIDSTQGKVCRATALLRLRGKLEESNILLVTQSTQRIEQ